MNSAVESGQEGIPSLLVRFRLPEYTRQHAQAYRNQRHRPRYVDLARRRDCSTERNGGH